MSRVVSSGSFPKGKQRPGRVNGERTSSRRLGALARAREAAGLTQHQAAALVNATLVEVRQWESDGADVPAAVPELLMLKTGQFTVGRFQFGPRSNLDLRLSDGQYVRITLPLSTIEALLRLWESAGLAVCEQCQVAYVGDACPGCRLRPAPGKTDVLEEGSRG